MPGPRGAILQPTRAKGGNSIKDMGRIMTALRERYAGPIDFTKASALVKGLLAK